jgi:hypothetical protein
LIQTSGPVNRKNCHTREYGESGGSLIKGLV